MTDRGTRVRWTTAALVAPAAAAVFTGTTVWAADHEPASAASTTTTSTASTAPAVAAADPAPAQPDPVIASLQAAVDANSVQVARLRRTVADLQAQAAAITKGIAAASVRTATSAGSSRSSARTSSTASTPKASAPRAAAPASRPAPVVRSAAPAPAPVPAPATHTTTGASGAVK